MLHKAESQLSARSKKTGPDLVGVDLKIVVALGKASGLKA
jgi:hypothetical protein